MWVLGLSYFSILATTFSPCFISLKPTLGPPNMDDQYSSIWDYINSILNNIIRCQTSCFFSFRGMPIFQRNYLNSSSMMIQNPNAYGNETQTTTKVEASADLKQLFNNLTSCLDDAKKEGGHLWWFLIIAKYNEYNSCDIGVVNKQCAGRISYSLGLIKNEIQERLQIDREKSYRS